jgi:hypothetical protein
VVYGLLANRLIEPAPKPVQEDDTNNPLTTPMPAQHGEATFRQGTPQFGSEPTVQDEPHDDTSLLVSQEAHLSYSDMVRPTIAQLMVVNGDGAGTVIPLTNPEYSLGRHRDNAIQIADLGVSGFHARLYRGPEGYVIEDLKSRNGTWVNNARVFVATLTGGDVLHVGQTDLRYEVLI